jgi:hypothetical protein
MKHKPRRKPSFQATTFLAGVVLLLILFVSAGYMFFLHQPGLSPDQEVALAELRARRASWEAKRPPAFRYEVERSCECTLDYTEPFDVVEYRDDPDNRAWIDEYFVKIEAAMLESTSAPVRYNPRFDFPNDFRLGDEEIFIRDFEVLEYADESP